ncbi:hypothetical protein J8J21_22720, partial [Mycobacterium tuberculosis]|nr:hypothetical protein [Mycobacterium tuberculosis]
PVLPAIGHARLGRRSRGSLLGWLAQLGLFRLLHGLLPSVVPGGGIVPALAGIATGLVALAGFALPPPVALGKVPPLRV